MSKKIPLGLALALVIAAMTATFTVTMSVSQRIYNGLIPNLYSRTSMSDSIDELNRIVGSNYYKDIDQAAQLAIDAKTAQGYIDGLDDGFSRYLTSEEYSEYLQLLKGTVSGTGISWGYDTEKEAVVVTDVSRNSSAANSDIQSGDIVLEVGGEEVTEENYLQLMQTLEGRRFSTVEMKLERGDESYSANVMIGYEAKTVKYSLLGDIGCIRISAFFENTDTQLSQAVDSLVKEGAAALVIDVRNNDAGTIEYAVKALDVFVPVAVADEGNGAAATLIYPKRDDALTYSTYPSDISLPMYVLVNVNSIGPAELFACDMRDFGKAQLLGEKTRGNATAQEIFELSGGGAVRLTVAEVLPYRSESYGDKGIIPDIEVTMSTDKVQRIGVLETAQDDQLSTAISMLSEQLHSDSAEVK